MLKHLPLCDAKRLLTIQGMSTVQELNGVRSIEKITREKKEVITSSRQFSIKVYDIETNTFSTLNTKLKEHMANATTGIIDDYIYIFGGHHNNHSTQLSLIQKFNPSTQKIQVLELETKTRDCIKAVSMGNKIYLFDGYNENNEHSKLIQILSEELAKTILDLAPVREIPEISNDNTLPTTKAVVTYIDNKVSNELENFKDLIPEIPEQVQSDFDENDSTSKAYIQNRPFYSIKDAKSVTETFYDSLNGDPTVDYVEREEFDSIQAVLTPSKSVQQYFKEGAEITYTLELLYDLTGSDRIDSTTETGIVQKYSDELLYVGDAWLVD
jgi:BMFP domain-containing protein YqiC